MPYCLLGHHSCAQFRKIKKNNITKTNSVRLTMCLVISQFLSETVTFTKCLPKLCNLRVNQSAVCRVCENYGNLHTVTLLRQKFRESNVFTKESI